MHRDIRVGWHGRWGWERPGWGWAWACLSSHHPAVRERGSQSHIKEMLQLVLNWEVSQAAAVRTGKIRGALCGPKQGQTLQRERRGFLGLPRKDLSETLRTGLRKWGSPGPEAWVLEVEEAPLSWPGAVGSPHRRNFVDGYHLQGILFGVGAEQAGLEPGGRIRDWQRKPGIQVG